jgi:hypothetical protein
MAVQSTPHTTSHQNRNSAQDDLEPNMNPQDTLRSDPALYENSDGAQTGGTRAFNANAGRDNQPKSIDEGTGLTAPNSPHQSEGKAPGVTNAPLDVEHERQEKVAKS